MKQTIPKVGDAIMYHRFSQTYYHATRKEKTTEEIVIGRVTKVLKNKDNEKDSVILRFINYKGDSKTFGPNTTRFYFESTDFENLGQIEDDNIKEQYPEYFL